MQCYERMPDSHVQTTNRPVETSNRHAHTSNCNFKYPTVIAEVRLACLDVKMSEIDTFRR